MARARASTAADCLAVASRVAAAAVGGYAFANVTAIFLTHVLPMRRADAVLATTLASFALYTCAVLWAFAARSPRSAWLGLLVPTAVLGLLALAIGGGA